MFSASSGAMCIEACAHARWISAMDICLEAGLVRQIPGNIFFLKIEAKYCRFGCQMLILRNSIQLSGQRLSHKSVKVYTTMPVGIMGRKSLALID